MEIVNKSFTMAEYNEEKRLEYLAKIENLDVTAAKPALNSIYDAFPKLKALALRLLEIAYGNNHS